MNPDQFIALLLVIADQRLIIESQAAEIRRLNEKADSNGQREPERAA